MKTKLLTLLMLFGLFSPLLAYGDDVPTKGGWHDDRYRSTTLAPPVLSIDGNLLSKLRVIHVSIGIYVPRHQIMSWRSATQTFVI